jgi:hypothetical protein
MTFTEALREQRWDDHRYYHHNRVNQALHLVSALTFIAAYALLWPEPAIAVLLAWLIAMPSRQIGHFFFEPHTYDVVNQATHEHKEDIKVGYNLRRKAVLLTIWAVSPLLLIASPSLFGLVTPAADWWTVANHVSGLWIVVGVGAVVLRSMHLMLIRNVQTGLVWATKIVTDPFHDVLLYHRAPLQILRGEMMEPAHAEASSRSI